MDDFIYKQDPMCSLSHCCGSEIALEVVPCLPVGLPGGFAEWAGGIDSAVIGMCLVGWLCTGGSGVDGAEDILFLSQQVFLSCEACSRRLNILISFLISDRESCVDREAVAVITSFNESLRAGVQVLTRESV